MALMCLRRLLRTVDLHTRIFGARLANSSLSTVPGSTLRFFVASGDLRMTGLFIVRSKNEKAAFRIRRWSERI